MLMMQYIHRLPADYEMEKLAKRAAGLAPDWDDTPGLGFKAFIAQRRGDNGAINNAYSSLYLWLDDEAASDFITGERFRKVIAALAGLPSRPGCRSIFISDQQLAHNPSIVKIS